ncbi:MAG: hypothetical protein HQM08_18070 [Candidatus Riflebacteria bacterium]|nr:hypothetical protein [Candidatus Riflebacteria bacterium]
MRVCKQDGLVDAQDRLIFENVGEGFLDFLDGKELGRQPVFNESALLEARKVLLRKGENRRLMRLHEFLYKSPSSNPQKAAMEENCMAAVCVEFGEYSRGIELARKGFQRLESSTENIRLNPVFLHFLLTQALLEAHLTDEAGKLMDKLNNLFEDSFKKDLKTITNELLKSYKGESRSGVSFDERSDIDIALFWHITGRLKTLSGSLSAAEDALQMAEAIMLQEKNRETLTLEYPEIKISQAFIALLQEDFKKSEACLKESLEYYHTKTRYRGRYYFSARGALSYSLLKQGSSESQTKEIEAALQGIEANVAENHLGIASCCIWLGESLIKDGNIIAARSTFERALRIRKAALPENDKDILAAQELISRLPQT